MTLDSTRCPSQRCETARQQGRNDERTALSETWKVNLRLIEKRHRVEALTDARDVLQAAHQAAWIRYRTFSIDDVVALLDEMIADNTIEPSRKGDPMSVIIARLDACD